MQPSAPVPVPDVPVPNDAVLTSDVKDVKGKGKAQDEEEDEGEHLLRNSPPRTNYLNINSKEDV
jgi:hypothetical protein